MYPLSHLISCIPSWGCFNCMTQNIRDQKPKVIWLASINNAEIGNSSQRHKWHQPASCWDEAWKTAGGCGFSQALHPIAPCSHLCRQAGVLLPGSGVHGKPVFVQRHCTPKEQLKLPSVARWRRWWHLLLLNCMWSGTFLRNTSGPLWKLYLLVHCWNELIAA